MVKCPECGGTCVYHNTKRTDPLRNIEKKTDPWGTVVGAVAGFIFGGPFGALIGAGVGSLANTSYYECTKCGRRFESLEEIKSYRC